MAEALSLAHEDGQLAKVLPYVLWRNRERMELERLVAEATKRDERVALGLFLEMAGMLGHAPELVRAARALRDQRRRRAKPFFTRATGRYALAAARLNTPSVARRWGYLMNMSLQTVAAVFRKHARLAVAASPVHPLEVTDCDFKLSASADESWNMRFAAHMYGRTHPCRVP